MNNRSNSTHGTVIQSHLMKVRYVHMNVNGGMDKYTLQVYLLTLFYFMQFCNCQIK